METTTLQDDSDYQGVPWNCFINLHSASQLQFCVTKYSYRLTKTYVSLMKWLKEFTFIGTSGKLLKPIVRPPFSLQPTEFVGQLVKSECVVSCPSPPGLALCEWGRAGGDGWLRPVHVVEADGCLLSTPHLPAPTQQRQFGHHPLRGRKKLPHVYHWGGGL